MSTHSKIQNCSKPKLVRHDEMGFWRCVHCGGYYFSDGGKIDGPMSEGEMERRKAKMPDHAKIEAEGDA